MRSVLAAVRRVFAAMMMFVLEWCDRTLQFVRKCMPLRLMESPRKYDGQE